MTPDGVKTMLALICGLELTLANVRELHFPLGKEQWCPVCGTAFPCHTYTVALGTPIGAHV